MTDYMQEIAKILKLAEVPDVEILQSDEAIFAVLKGYIASLQDIAAKADTWRLSAECDHREYAVRQSILHDIRRALIDFGVITEPTAAVSPEGIGYAVVTALEYLAATRDRLAFIEKSTERTIELRTDELRQKIDVLESQVQFHRDTAKNLEGYNEGLAAALRIVLDTRGR